MTTTFRRLRKGGIWVARGYPDFVGGTQQAGRDALVVEVDEPDAANTGVIPGTTLTTLSGTQTITTAGTTIQDKEIFGSVIIRAANVSLINCRIRGDAAQNNSVDCTSGSCVNALIKDCEIFSDNPSRLKQGIQGHDFTALRCNIYGVVDPINLVCGGKGTGTPLVVTVQQCYMHDFSWFTPDSGHSDNMTHNDGIQIQGGLGPLTFQGNAIHASYSATVGVLTGMPDRGTGTAANGRFNWGDLTCIQFTDAPTNVYTVGSSSGANAINILGNWCYGSKRAINAGSAVSVNLGNWWRNKFDDSQGERGSLSAKQGYTITMDPTTVCDTGDGTANKNVYMSDGSAITVRRNQ